MISWNTSKRILNLTWKQFSLSRNKHLFFYHLDSIHVLFLVLLGKFSFFNISKKAKCFASIILNEEIVNNTITQHEIFFISEFFFLSAFFFHLFSITMNLLYARFHFLQKDKENGLIIIRAIPFFRKQILYLGTEKNWKKCLRKNNLIAADDCCEIGLFWICIQ